MLIERTVLYCSVLISLTNFVNFVRSQRNIERRRRWSGQLFCRYVRTALVYLRSCAFDYSGTATSLDICDSRDCGNCGTLQSHIVVIGIIRHLPSFSFLLSLPLLFLVLTHPFILNIFHSLSLILLHSYILIWFFAPLSSLILILSYVITHPLSHR